ncbi:MAG: zinc-binding dehydrogenase [Thermoleophilia bacterium]|nr:zinc-binding dehydrogenase [Thermoleophilia bacterium]
MTDTMLALTYDRSRDPWETTTGLRLQRVPRPSLELRRDYRDGAMALIRPLLTGFCGSDRGIWYRHAFGDMIHDSLNSEGGDVRVIGHELLGEIVQVGTEATRDYGFLPGDIVAAESHIIDDTCYQCRVGDKHVCATAQIIGISLDGCFSELVKLPAKALWPTDITKIRPEVAALQEPFGNAVHACTKVNLRGQSVAIIGLGTIGLFAVAVARALGARQVIGVEPVEHHRRMGLALGADAVIRPSQPTAQSYIHDAAITEAVRDLTDGVGVDVAIEMSGATAALNTALVAVRRGGHVILFGIRSGDAIIEHLDRVIVDGISMHSVVGRRIWETWHITRNLLESRRPNIHDAIFDVILEGGRDCIVPVGDFDAARFELLMNAHPKVMIRWGER